MRARGAKMPDIARKNGSPGRTRTIDKVINSPIYCISTHFDETR